MKQPPPPPPPPPPQTTNPSTIFYVNKKTDSNNFARNTKRLPPTMLDQSWNYIARFFDTLAY